jgi:hypothetical protein
MHEKVKLKEAKYFYSMMVKEQENYENFKFNLSAFLSSTRSVMQYALREAQAKPGGQFWHDSLMKSPVLEHFKGKRDVNIHEVPIDAQKSTLIEIMETIYLSESVHVVITDKNGNVKEDRDIPVTPPPSDRTGESSVKSSSTYNFADWPGDEDILTLCDQYLRALEIVIQDGITRGFITG